jgi:O-antigen/teichoic acid export membrane protein
MRLPAFLSRHREFIGNVATLMSGKAAAGLVAFFTMPIVSRLFTPSDFGVAALFVSIISILARVASLRYEAAIVLPKDDHEAVALMALSYRLVFFSCFLVLMFVVLHEASGSFLSALELLGGLKWLLPIGLALMAAIHIQDFWLTRTKSFRVASASLVVGNVTTGGARIGFGMLVGSTAGGLITGHVLGMISRLAVQKAASRDAYNVMRSDTTRPPLREIATRYIDFPKLNAPAALIFILGQNLPVLLFGVMFSPAVAGLYSMANQIVRAPVDMVANSTRRVFLQKASSISNENRSLQKAFLVASGGLALLGTPALVLLWLFGQPMATWFLGVRWEVAGRYLEIIAPWLFMLWVMAPCNPIFIVLREQRLWLLLQIGLTVLRLGVFGMAYILAAGPEWTLQAFVLATILGNAVTWSTALTLIREHSSK